MANCVAVVKQQGVASAGDFSVRLAPKPVATAPPPVGGSLRPDAPQNASPEMQIEAIELASNFILKTTLHNPRVLSRAETPIAVASHGAAWKSDEAVGFVRIVPPMDGIKGLDVASAVVATDARDCKGKLLPVAPANWSIATSYSGDFPPARIPTARAFRNTSSSRERKAASCYSLSYPT